MFLYACKHGNTGSLKHLRLLRWDGTAQEGGVNLDFPQKNTANLPRGTMVMTDGKGG